MELVKREDHWALYNEDGHKIAATVPGCNSKLSIKNCEAIANGYDLDELGMDYASTIYDGRTESIRFNGAHIDFMKGFKKALEILGDKKFSEKELKFNMLQLFYLKKNEGEEEAIFRERQLSFIEKSIQSLQQTEWEVEIITKPFIEVSEGFNLEQKREPKLDSNDCLILRRI